MPVLETSFVTSADGTSVCFRTLGDGPSLVVAHGAFSTSDDYVPLAVRLATSHRVVLVDRRGYRDSEVGPLPATYVQDAEDLDAVIAALGSSAFVFGDSAGAIAAMCAALVVPERVRALALYEPPILFGGPQRQPLLDRYRQLRERGEDGEALVAFTSATTTMPEEVVRLWVDAPTPGPRSSAIAAGVGRDLEAAVALTPDFERWRVLAAPVTLLVGAGPEHEPAADSARGLGAVLPRSRTLTLGGPDRVARVLDPDVLAGALRTAFGD